MSYLKITYIHFTVSQRYEECLGDFQHAFKALRGNQLIDYKALGLRYKLFACEVCVYNHLTHNIHIKNE